MAELDNGSVGIKVLGGLPEGNGLPMIASEVLDDPKPVFALVELRPVREVTNLEVDSHQVILRIVQIEPLAGKAADTMRDQLRKVREKRTGVVPLPGVDDAEVPPAGDGEAQTPPADLPTGPEWGDGPEPAVVPSDSTPTAAADTAAPTPTSAAPAPEFVAPTPIGKKRSQG